jgi:hypothetical protein
MATNRTRRRISDSQMGLLHMLNDGKGARMIKYLCDIWYRGNIDDPKQQVRAIKRALKRLEYWGLVRTFYAPHDEAHKSWGDFADEAEANLRRRRWESHQGGLVRGLSYNAMRVLYSELGVAGGNGRGNRIAPAGNRKEPALWVEITDAGRSLLSPPGDNFSVP